MRAKNEQQQLSEAYLEVQNENLLKLAAAKKGWEHTAKQLSRSGPRPEKGEGEGLLSRIGGALTGRKRKEEAAADKARRLKEYKRDAFDHKNYPNAFKEVTPEDYGLTSADLNGSGEDEEHDDEIDEFNKEENRRDLAKPIHSWMKKEKPDPLDDHSSVEAYRAARGIRMP